MTSSKTERRRRVLAAALTLPCPYCLAPARVECTSRTPHPSRLRLARRMLATGAQWQLVPLARDRPR